MTVKQSGIFKITAVTLMFFIILWVILFIVLQLVYPVKYSSIVDKYSQRYNVESALVYSVMKTESGFSESAKSSKNAIGLMQITSDTAYWIADRMNVDDFILSDPETNIMFSCWYMRYLTDKFGETKTALAAYNAGEGNVQRWLDTPSYSSDGVSLDKIPYGETDRYVKAVMKTYNIYNKLYSMR